ncbi:hypothetical protein JCM8097_006642 [Rhodosporidiobolus ruineniae]
MVVDFVFHRPSPLLQQPKVSPRLPLEVVELIAHFLLASFEHDADDDEEDEAWLAWSKYWMREVYGEDSDEVKAIERLDVDDLLDYAPLGVDLYEKCYAQVAKVFSLVCKDWSPVGRSLLWRELDTYRTSRIAEDDRRLAVVGPFVRHLVIRGRRCDKDVYATEVGVLSRRCTALQSLDILNLPAFFCECFEMSGFRGITSLKWSTGSCTFSAPLHDMLRAVGLLVNLSRLDLDLHATTLEFDETQIAPTLPQPKLRYLRIDCLSPRSEYYGAEDQFLLCLPAFVDLTALESLDLLSEAGAHAVNAVLSAAASPGCALPLVDLSLRLLPTVHTALLPQLCSHLATFAFLRSVSLALLRGRSARNALAVDSALLERFYLSLPPSLRTVKTPFQPEHPGRFSLEVFLAQQENSALQQCIEVEDIEEWTYSVVEWQKKDDGQTGKEWVKTPKQFFRQTFA